MNKLQNIISFSLRWVIRKCWGRWSVQYIWLIFVYIQTQSGYKKTMMIPVYSMVTMLFYKWLVYVLKENLEANRWFICQVDLLCFKSEAVLNEYFAILNVGIDFHRFHNIQAHKNEKFILKGYTYNLIFSFSMNPSLLVRLHDGDGISYNINIDTSKNTLTFDLLTIDY